MPAFFILKYNTRVKLKSLLRLIQNNLDYKILCRYFALFRINPNKFNMNQSLLFYCAFSHLTACIDFCCSPICHKSKGILHFAYKF